MNSIVKQSVKQQRELLTSLLGGKLARLSKELPALLYESELLNSHLVEAISDLPYCKYIYVLDASARQLSATVSHNAVKLKDAGRDRSLRPYMKNMFTPRQGVDFELSGSYISTNKKRPSITGVQLIRGLANERLGFLGVDYDLRELPREDKIYDEPRSWRQIKGDPAIRGGLFLQQRVESQMDIHLNDIMSIIEELMLENGVYHCQIHYASSRVTIWHVDDPYIYRILTMDELSNSEICLVYPKRSFFERNIIPREDIMKVFLQFRALRLADETVYLRSGSLNLVNGFIGLNFSCDGTHYLTFDDFLSRGLNFWFGMDRDTTGENNNPSAKAVDKGCLDTLLEDIAQSGCLEVKQFINIIESGKTPDKLKLLDKSECDYIYDELKSIMAVYEDDVCSI